MESNGHTTASPAVVADSLLAELAPELARAGKAATSKNLPGVGTIYLRGKTWWIKYSVHGRRVRETSGSQRESDAVKMLRRRIEEVGKSPRRDPSAENRVRMTELFDALAADYRDNGRRSAATLTFRLNHLREVFGHDRAIDVTAARIARYAQERLAENAKRATVNRELAALRRAFALAVERERLSLAPSVKLFAENNARQGFVNNAQLEAIAAALPAHLRDVTRFGYLTGWRRGEVTTLEWSDVDLESGRITLRRERSKNGQPRTVPFAAVGTEGANVFVQLGEIIRRRVQARTASDDGQRYVFHRGGRRLRDFRGAWESACKAAECAGLLFHDLRRSAVRNLVAAGVDQAVAMRITGHKTVTVFQRYRIVADDDVRAALERVQAPSVPAEGTEGTATA